MKLFNRTKAPKGYQEFISLTHNEAKEYCMNSIEQPVRRHVSKIIKNDMVLEIGCGNGIDAPFYLPKQYRGIDVSPELISVAKLRNPKHIFLSCDAEQYLDRCQKFNYIYCKAVLEHQPSVAKMLRLYGRMIEKSDTLLIAWHMKPNNKTKIHVVKGHFGKMVYQNEYDKKLFEIPGVKIEKECIENYELWSVKNEV